MVTSEPPVSENEKREALEAVLHSHTFARSAQLRALLSYICDRELAGRPEELTEYQIAVDVLGRRKDFSLTDDSTVRNRAYELRQRLEKYYSSEQPGAGVRIEIPRGGYVPNYTRHQLAAVPDALVVLPPRTSGGPAGHGSRRLRLWAVTGIAVACLALGWVGGTLVGQPHPPSILKEAWGPLARPGTNLLISIATNMHMLVRPHIALHPQRLPAPDEAYALYGPTRPLQTGVPLYMEPAQLSVPLAELAATATLSNMLLAFGGSYQILPESEAPVAALRGRNSALIGSGTNSEAATVLLRDMPLTIDYTEMDQFALLDHRKPAGQNVLLLANPVPTELYGLLSVITTVDSSGEPRRTLVMSGAGSAGVQSAAEFFCSPVHMRELKERFVGSGFDGFPPNYQVVVKCKTTGPRLRLISYEYAMHVVVPRSGEQGR